MPAGAPRVEVSSDGNNAVGISWPTSASRLAVPIPATPGVIHFSASAVSDGYTVRKLDDVGSDTVTLMPHTFRVRVSSPASGVVRRCRCPSACRAAGAR